jgi:serine phosphatase RsbU (regulator of sigma subunit)
MVGRHQRAVRSAGDEHPVTAAPPRAAVGAYVAVTTIAAATAAFAAHSIDTVGLPLDLLAFIGIAALTDLREIRLPRVGHVTLSFVPVLAALIVFGLWPAIVVAAVSGLATIGVTRDPQKIVFNVADYVLSTFYAGLVFVTLTPPDPSLARSVLPAFAATGVDFLLNTALLAGVLAIVTGENALRLWQRNYQWGLPSYMTGASLALLVAWLYLWLGIPGLLLGLPPLYLIYYSYDVYVVRARERVQYSREVASFRDDLASTLRLQDELQEAQRKVAVEIERARGIQADLLPREAPATQGLAIANRIEFMSEMGGDYFDFLKLPDGRLGIACGDVMGKGLAAALIMTMARSLLHRAAQDGASPSQVLGEVNDSLTHDLEDQQAPCFLTLTYAIYDPLTHELTLANGGHNPTLVFGTLREWRMASRGSVLGLKEGLTFPEDHIELLPGDTVAFFTDGLTESRDGDRVQLGLERLVDLLRDSGDRPVDEALTAVWDAVAGFRGGEAAGDDATLLLLRTTS